MSDRIAQGRQRLIIQVAHWDGVDGRIGCGIRHERACQPGRLWGHARGPPRHALHHFVRQLTRGLGDQRLSERATEVIAVPGPGTHSTESVSCQRVGQGVAFRVGDAGMRLHLDNPT